jgi:hypothetical protein
MGMLLWNGVQGGLLWKGVPVSRVPNFLQSLHHHHFILSGGIHTQIGTCSYIVTFE